MSKKRLLHINFSTYDSDEPVSFAISKYTLISLIMITGLLILAIIFSVVYVTNKSIDINKVTVLENQNKLLKNQLSKMNHNLDSLMIKLDSIDNFEDKIRAKENLKKIPKDIRNMGTGGYPIIDSLFTSNVLNIQISQISNKLNTLNNKISFDLISHKKVLSFLNLKSDLLRATPCIYPAFGRITSWYGWRINPVTKRRAFHHGVDIGSKIGTPIYATADGVITETGRLKLFGKFVTIKHKFSYKTKYAHLHKILVKKGDHVVRGQIIALMGNTGRSTGAHLHYEVWKFGRNINPRPYLHKRYNDIIVRK
jgi:murein DD-endopeptidase MepM/ murein hydrolase activator NlpD